MSRTHLITLLIFLSSLHLASSNQNTTKTPSTAPERVGWYSAPNYRSTLDILWTCLFTVFLCCWTAIHPDIPPPDSTLTQQWLDRAICLCIGAIAPEVFIYIAFVERWDARTKFLDAPYGLRDDQWSLTHRFYAMMGGFCVRVPWFQPGSLTNQRVMILGPGGLQELLRLGWIDAKSFVTAKEIRDKGKADGIVKAFALLQILWVVLQSVVRAVQRLPLTTLEISTLAYIPCAAFIFWLWWDKPYDIGVPTMLVVATTGNGDRDSELLAGRKIPYRPYRTYSLARECKQAVAASVWPLENRFMLARGPPSIIFLIVGSIHLAAWNFDFPSPFEQWAWRTCSLLITVVLPFSWAVSQAVLWVALFWFERERVPVKILKLSVGIQGLAAGLYAVARLYLITEVFVGLRSAPIGVYKTPEWTAFIPHV